jgi:hypothetical protein
MVATIPVHVIMLLIPTSWVLVCIHAVYRPGFDIGGDAWNRLTSTTSAIPLPWPTGCRSETLRPPLSVEFAFVGDVEISAFYIGIFI